MLQPFAIIVPMSIMPIGQYLHLKSSNLSPAVQWDLFIKQISDFGLNNENDIIKK